MPIFESQPMTIGKHEWRVIVKPSSYMGGNCTEYQWRPANPHGLPGELRDSREPWRSHEEWPHYNINDGMYLGLPKTLRALYDRNRTELDWHLHGIAMPADPQASFDFSGPADTPPSITTAILDNPKAFLPEQPQNGPDHGHGNGQDAGRGR